MMWHVENKTARVLTDVIANVFLRSVCVSANVQRLDDFMHRVGPQRKPSSRHRLVGERIAPSLTEPLDERRAFVRVIGVRAERHRPFQIADGG
jgi:hypothetical protein